MTFLSNRHSIETFNRLSNESQLSNQSCTKRLFIWLWQFVKQSLDCVIWHFISIFDQSWLNIQYRHSRSTSFAQYNLLSLSLYIEKVWESFDLKELYWFASWLHEFFYFLFNQLKIIFQSNDFFRNSSCVWFRSSQYDNCFRYSSLSFCIFNYLQKSAWERERIWKSKTIISTRRRANTIQLRESVLSRACKS